MPFIKPLPHWESQGTEPPLSLRQNGWQAGVKPPSEYFNYLQNRCYEALKELQEKAGEIKTVNNQNPDSNGNVNVNVDTSSLATKAELEAETTARTTHTADYLKHTGYAVATGSANTYAATLNPALSAYAEGVSLRLKVNVANTGASTVNVNGLGAKAIKKSNGNDVGAGNLKAGSVYTLAYDGTSFILQGEGGEYGDATAGQVLAPNTIGTDAGVIPGTMPNRAGDTAALSSSVVGTTLKLRASNGYRDGVDDNVTITDPAFIASNIKSGVNIFGVGGSLKEVNIIPADFGEANAYSLSTTGSTGMSTSSTTPVLQKAIVSGIKGTIRTHFGLRLSSSVGNNALGQIYVNGVPKGIQRSTNNTTFVQYYEDIAVEVGDLIELYTWKTLTGTTYNTQFDIAYKYAPIAASTVTIG